MSIEPPGSLIFEMPSTRTLRSMCSCKGSCRAFGGTSPHEPSSDSSSSEGAMPMLWHAMWDESFLARTCNARNAMIIRRSTTTCRSITTACWLMFQPVRWPRGKRPTTRGPNRSFRCTSKKRRAMPPLNRFSTKGSPSDRPREGRVKSSFSSRIWLLTSVTNLRLAQGLLVDFLTLPCRVDARSLLPNCKPPTVNFAKTGPIDSGL